MLQNLVPVYCKDEGLNQLAWRTCHTFLCCFKSSTAISAGIRTGNSVFVLQKMGFACISCSLIQFGISEKPGLSWWGLEAHSEKCLGTGLSGAMASDNVVCTVSSMTHWIYHKDDRSLTLN